MSYDVNLLARNVLTRGDLTVVLQQLRTDAKELSGELFIASSEVWTGGERVGTLCLPDDVALSPPQPPAWKRFFHLARRAGLDLYNPQTGTEIHL
jgi:hypothetical protein